MRLRVIVPPAAFLSPTDIASTNDPADPVVTALIAAATEEIDGPLGWLGRAIGPQTLELAIGLSEYCHDLRLPCPPLIDIDSIKYFDRERVEQTLDPSTYDQTDSGVCLHRASLPSSIWWWQDALRIQYRAGYDGNPVEDGGTGPIPVRIKQAVIFSVQQLSALGAENLFLSSEQVEGVGQTNYVVSPNAENMIRNTMDRLLAGLWVFA